jgi:formate C-acetyltransferase
VYDDKTYENEEFIKLLNMEDSEFYNELRNCPCFGVDDEYADAFATDFATKIFDTLKQKIPYLGGKFLAASIQFITYDTAGKNILSTPDGRKNFEPLCDSIGAVHGKDINGPTALLNSVAKLPLTKAIGTPVLNFRLQKKNIPNTLRPLVLGFFKQGGLQMQVSCISKEDLEDALIHPEKHGNLIVRIGGYSEYFYRLSTDLKKAVIERTEHGT